MSHRLRRGNWSVQELERLRLLLPHRGVEQTAALLRRSADSVQRKALDLLKVPPRKGSWTDSDDWQLRQAWGAVELRLLAPMLGRPPSEVRSRAAELRSRLNSGQWTREESRLLKKLYGTRADEDLEVSLMRSRSEIAAAAQRMCLAKDKKFQAACNNRAAVAATPVDKSVGATKNGKAKPVVRSRMPRWTSAEVEKLRELYPDHDNLAVARALGRSVTSVANKAFQLGIHKSAALLTSIGRSNISHRYQSEEGLAEERQVAGRSASGPDVIIPVPAAGASVAGAPVDGAPTSRTAAAGVGSPPAQPRQPAVETEPLPRAEPPAQPVSAFLSNATRPSIAADQVRVAQEGTGDGGVPIGD